MEFHVLFTIHSKCIVTERGLMISHYQTGKLSLNGRRITLTMLQSKCISNTKDHLFKHFISVLPTKRISLQFRQRDEAIPPFFILFLPGSLPTIITLFISKNAKKRSHRDIHFCAWIRARFFAEKKEHVFQAAADDFCRRRYATQLISRCQACPIRLNYESLFSSGRIKRYFLDRV